MVQAFEQASGKTIAYRIMARRPGDIATCYADPSLACAELGWKAEVTLEEGLRRTFQSFKDPPRR